MGSEHSTQNVNSDRPGGHLRSGVLRRGKSVPNREPIEDDSRCTSPGPSVCSDSDLPYISYTVNRPIGDSPKMTNKQSQQIKGKSLGSQSGSIKKSSISQKKSSKAHNIVVVKAATSDPSTETDPDLLKLKSIPMFLPIMRGTLNLPPRVRDPEVLERLDPIGLFNLCARYQHHLNYSAQMVASEQNALCTNIESKINKTILIALERQKNFAKFAEQLSQVHELSRMITKCQEQLDQTLKNLEILNNQLPHDERLELFIWPSS